MTTFMKIEAITYCVLKVINYIMGFVGAFGILGAVGSLECDTITFAQFWLYELCAFGLIGLTIVVYYIRECIREDFLRRNRILNRTSKKAN